MVGTQRPDDLGLAAESDRGWRCAPGARRGERACREHVSEPQRSPRGCSANREEEGPGYALLHLTVTQPGLWEDLVARRATRG